MATATESTQGSVSRSQGSARVGSPISNEAYDVIAALHAKLEGLEAYRKYAKDGDAPLWEELTQVELKSVSRLADELERLVRDGEFRLEEEDE